MPDFVNRTAAAGLIREDVAEGILKNATLKSAAMQLIKKRPMSKKQTRLPIINSKPSAGFVTGSDTDVGLKAVTAMDWSNIYLNAEPIATIVVMSEDVLDDADTDLWEQIKPELEEAVAVAIDRAVFFGYDGLGNAIPSTWPTAIVPAAIAAGNVVNYGTGVDLAADLNSAMAAVEADGMRPNGWFMRMNEESTLRGLRDANRQFLFDPDGPANTGLADAAYQGRIYAKPAYSSEMGFSEFDTGAGKTRFVVGDFRKAVLGVRSDIKYKMITEGVIQWPDGSIRYNLPQQDLVALRLVLRIGWQVLNPPTRMNPDGSTRYPWAVLRTAP